MKQALMLLSSFVMSLICAFRSLLSRKQNVQVSDTTSDATSIEADYKILIFIKKFMQKIVLTIFLSLIICFGTQAQSTDSLEVVHTINNFVDAFSNLEWNKFTAFFADDATAFFPPSAKIPYRANNKTEIENIFQKVFENARKQKSSPPYLTIEPKDLKIQMFTDVVIVTFELEDPGMFGRRTLVLKKENDSWLIVHLHASGIPSAN